MHKDIFFNVYTEAAIQEALKRILLPSIELEVRGELKEFAETKAIKVFEENLLLTPPFKNNRYRSCF